MNIPPTQAKITVVTIVPTTLIIPWPEKNCMISWPVAKPEPIAQATNAPAYLITFAILKLLLFTAIPSFLFHYSDNQNFIHHNTTF